MKVSMFIFIFLMVGAFFIISNNNLYILKDGSLSSFVSLYSDWLAKIVENSAQVTGFVVRLDWLPNNSTG